MALSTLVKLSNVTNLTDARYAAGMGVSIIGFPIVLQGETTFGRDDLEQIVGWLAGVELCGEFYGATADEIVQIMQQLNLSYAEVHEPVLALQLAGLNIPYLFNVDRVGNVSDRAVHDAIAKAKFVVVSGQVAALSSEETKPRELVRISMPSQIDALDLGKHAGVAIDGTPEDKPGLKDMTPLQEILEKLEVEG